jgi:hypothetical protein
VRRVEKPSPLGAVRVVTGKRAANAVAAVAVRATAVPQ